MANEIMTPDDKELRQVGEYEIFLEEETKAPVEAELEIKQNKLVYDTVVDQITAYHLMINIADQLDETELAYISQKVIDDYRIDKSSRADWENTYREILEIAKLMAKEKIWAGEKVANIKYPLIAQAAISFHARAYPLLIKNREIVKCKIIGKDDENETKLKRTQRIAKHMSYQATNQMEAFEEEVDQLLITYSIVGSMFKKTYYDGINEQNVSETIFPDDLIVNYYTKSIEKATRITHIIELTKNEIIERIRAGIFLDFDIDLLGVPAVRQDEGIAQSRIKTQTGYDEQQPHIFYEQHRWLDLDEDGYEEPYIVTVHENSRKVVRIAARWDADNVISNKKGEIIKIKPINYFTRYIFMPAIDGNFYGMGFGNLMLGLNQSVNSTANQLIDSGTINNRPSGFIGKGINLSLRGGGTGFKVAPAEWKKVNITGDDLKKNLVPIPTKPPSLVLFKLLGYMVDAGKELVSMTDILSGNIPHGRNVPATTILALIEQGLKVFSGIYLRLYRSFHKELKQLYRLNRLYLTQDKYQEVLDDKEANVKLDYNTKDHDILPVSDPANASDAQRIMKAQALIQMLDMGFNDEEIKRRYLEALQCEDIEKLLPEEPPGPTPMEEAELQAKQFEAQKTLNEAALINEKIRTEQVMQLVRQSGMLFDETKLNIEKANSLADIEATVEKLALERARLLKEFEKIDLQREQDEALRKANELMKIETKKRIVPSELKGKTAETGTQGAYREKGMRSNNLKVVP